MWLGAVYKTSRRQSFFVGVRRVSEQTHPRDNLIDPLCLCRAPMSLTHSEDECPGYQRQTFECPVCGGTMTQWKGVSSARCTTQRKRAANVGVGNPVGAFGCQSLSRASTGSNPERHRAEIVPRQLATVLRPSLVGQASVSELRQPREP
jgi:hypothetical protein